VDVVRVSRRAQLVVLAAAVVALALVPMAAAYLQLGYQAGVSSRADHPLEDANATLSRGVAAAATGVPARYNWSDRRQAARAVDNRLADWRRGIERANPTLLLAPDNDTATRIAARGCPRGPDRAFGRCVARSGLVLQERANETHVVAAAVSARLLAEDRRANATLVVSPGR